MRKRRGEDVERIVIASGSREILRVPSLIVLTALLFFGYLLFLLLSSHHVHIVVKVLVVVAVVSLFMCFTPPKHLRRK